MKRFQRMKSIFGQKGLVLSIGAVVAVFLCSLGWAQAADKGETPDWLVFIK